MVSITDAKIVDYQAGLETMQNVLMLLAAGVDHVSESLGILDSYMTTSYEKIIIDLEILSRVERIMQGIDTSTYEDDIKAIKEMGPGGVFLTHPDTLKSFKNRWRPTISCWDSYNDWEKKGSLSIEEEANKKYKEILKKSPDSLIDDKIDKKLKKYMDDILENN